MSTETLQAAPDPTLDSLQQFLDGIAKTPLLTAAKARGNPVVDGVGMLLHQARPGFEAWFGVAPMVDAALRAAVLGVG